jgi:hypothetical protein
MRGAPPQATKLLTYSLAAGIVFMALLGIVFLPRMFPDQPPVAIIDLHVSPSAGRLDVVFVTAVLDVGRFNATLWRNDVAFGFLPAGLGGGDAALRFFDGNVTGSLDVGDHFEFATDPSGCFRFEMFQLDVNRRVAFERWGPCPTT